MRPGSHDGQTAFANIAFFYLCQISLNHDLSADKIEAMWKDTTAAVASIGTASVATPTINSVQPRQRAEEAGDVEGRDSGGEGSIVPGFVPDLPAAEIEAQEDDVAPAQDNG
ncbi:MAG: hypothetical protein DI569_06740 [Sphingopyxis macrogoltabida]|uniref:Uncharacterized protein n=1 Tax=Sphingopyxis macrogoltabida TaxID=33050 RepID=A0A2W5L0E5_SPHMC|nr:MAG: hypothetical protein DI569_06740 [Sphingopyxis macrogoltabida]